MRGTAVVIGVAIGVAIVMMSKIVGAVENLDEEKTMVMSQGVLEMLVLGILVMRRVEVVLTMNRGMLIHVQAMLIQGVVEVDALRDKGRDKKIGVWQKERNRLRIQRVV